MSCEEVQREFSEYLDDRCTLPMRAACDDHLRQCPVCRADLAQMRSLTRGLAMLARPTMPVGLVESIQSALAIEAGLVKRPPRPTLREQINSWFDDFAVPYAVGSVVSVLLFVSMLGALRPHFVALHDAGVASAESIDFDINRAVSPMALAVARAPFSIESPTLNPRGALAALTREPSHGDGDADEMIVVTDVFANGRAALADVVRMPRDARMLVEFQEALRRNPAFVPAAFDGRPETMRVVLSFQKVDAEKNF